jgi:hypothetical protein
MDKDKIIEALEVGSIEWRRHALERMLERDISRAEVKMTLQNGEIIENYVPSRTHFYDDLKTRR